MSHTSAMPATTSSWRSDATVRLRHRWQPPIPGGEALPLLVALQPDLRIVNLEAAVTTADRPWPGKAVHYRLHPANVACLQAAGIDACCLANNHVLDWGLNGLAETLRSLHQVQGPARLPLPEGGRLLLFAWALASSGVPLTWGARLDQPGVALLPAIDRGTAKWMSGCIRRQRCRGDRVVVALYWGANWVPVVPEAHRWLARQLIDLAEVDVVYGHSSHHPLPLEIHAGKLILYGCGDLINDSEGLPLHGPWRSDLVCCHLLDLDPDTGALLGLTLNPFQLHRRLAVGAALPQWRRVLRADPGRRPLCRRTLHRLRLQLRTPRHD